jgi:hypothetical protein
MAYEPKVQSVMAEHPTLIPVMITLTIKNGFDLGERILHLKQAWRKMIAAARKGKSDKCHDGKIEWNKVMGSLRSIEVTLSEKTGWHPHAHVFALVDQYIDQAKLSAEWARFTEDSFIVGITECKNGILPGLIEVVKYSTKFSDMEPDEVWHVFKTAAGSRFFDPQGALRGVPEPEIAEDDIEGLTGPWRDFLALWNWGKEGYQLRDVPADYENLPTRPAKKP